MLTTLLYAFVIFSGVYLTVHHWRRRTINPKARIAAGLEVFATGLWVVLLVSHLS